MSAQTSRRSHGPTTLQGPVANRSFRVISSWPGPDDPEYYPSSDGEPLAENTLHFLWIMTLHQAVQSVYKNEPDVFVASDLLWYPIKGNRRHRRAPDVMVVYGRPKREGQKVPSYLQWWEEDIPPRVVIEVRSDSDVTRILDQKFKFYQDHGVAEYLLIDPETATTEAWLRQDDKLVKVPSTIGWQSPNLGLRFGTGGKFNIAYADGTPVQETSVLLDQERQRRELAEAAQKQAEARNAALMAMLRQAGLDPDAVV